MTFRFFSSLNSGGKKGFARITFYFLLLLIEKVWAILPLQASVTSSGPFAKSYSSQRSPFSSCCGLPGADQTAALPLRQDQSRAPPRLPACPPDPDAGRRGGNQLQDHADQEDGHVVGHAG